MKIGILSFRSSGRRVPYEESRLLKAARQQGHTAQIFRVDQCQLYYDGTHPKVLFKEKIFPKCDLIIPRPTVLRNVDLYVSIIKQFQMMKVPVVNGYMPVTRAKNKLRTMQMLNNEHIAVPKTMLISDEKYLESAIKRVGGAPVIMKTPFGSYGAGVVLAESKRSVKSAWDMLRANTAAGFILIQEYIKESKGRDIRVFVLGGKVIASMERRARRGEFRSNIELGGVGKAVQIDEQTKSIAIKASKAIGLQVAGVDVIKTKQGPAVMEVNCNPGFHELELATGLDIAGKIIQHSSNYAKRYKAKFGQKKKPL